MLKRLLLTSAACIGLAEVTIAADLPVAAPAPPPPAFTWTGFYVGAQIGYGWGEDSGHVWAAGPFGQVVIPSIYASSSTQTQGVIGGGHLGYNWQINQFVFGLEGQVDGSSLSKTTSPVPSLDYTARTELPTKGTVLGRVGYAIDRTLLYVTGGGGYAWLRNTYSVLGQEGDFSTTRAFWTVGGGIEYAIDNNWSVRAQYRYNNYGWFYDGTIVFPSVFQSHQWKQHEVQVGFSYKFTPPPPPAVVAKY